MYQEHKIDNFLLLCFLPQTQMGTFCNARNLLHVRIHQACICHTPSYLRFWHTYHCRIDCMWLRPRLNTALVNTLYNSSILFHL